ncbi:MAG TPA: tetratricopeptide repeat protein [Candidatus Acidoferrum sp.]|nr:tetratricopeptide repeat protein [Candidatus Acidoferrum sp.]
MRPMHGTMLVSSIGKTGMLAAAAAFLFYGACAAGAVPAASTQHSSSATSKEKKSKDAPISSSDSTAAANSSAYVTNPLSGVDSQQLLSKANAGDAASQAELADRFLYGIGMKTDYVLGLSWAGKAAAQGNARGQYLLGECSSEGWATAKDKKTAADWWEKSANQGYPQGEYAYGHYWIDRGNNGSAVDYVPYGALIAMKHYRNEAHKGQDYIRSAAQHGFASAQYETGEYALGGKDYDSAISWLEKSSAQGNIQAQVALGNLYFRGAKKFSKDPVKGVSWYQQAAAKNDPEAEEALGDAYRDGSGVPKDSSQAIDFYKKAGMEHVHHLSLLDASNSFKKAADLNDPQAEVWLATLYAQGVAGKKNKKKADEIYAKLASQNYQGSQTDLAALNQELSQAQASQQELQATQALALAQGKAAYNKEQAELQAKEQANQPANSGSDRKSWIAVVGLGAASLASSSGASPTAVLQTGLSAAALTAKLTSKDPNDATTAILTGAAQGANGQVDSPILDAAHEQSQRILALAAHQPPPPQQPHVQSAAMLQSGASASSGNGLPMPEAGPIHIVFSHLADWGQGGASATSSPTGINCPGACSTYVQKGMGGYVVIQADSNSIIHQVNCGFYETAGSTLPRTPGNNWTCTLPSVNAWEGGTITVYVDAVGTYSGQQVIMGNGKQIPPGATNCGSLATGFVPCPGTGTSAPTGANGNSNDSGSGGSTTAGGSGFAPGGGGLNPKANSGGCTNANSFVSARVKVASDGFVVGFLTNNSNQTLYVTYTFGRGGKPYGPESGAVSIRSGQTVGGEMGGIWATNDVDHNPPEIFWYAVPQSDENAGKNCGSAW